MVKEVFKISTKSNLSWMSETSLVYKSLSWGNEIDIFLNVPDSIFHLIIISEHLNTYNWTKAL